jgi:aminoglycoside 6'-N-acetyltransferase I
MRPVSASEQRVQIRSATPRDAESWVRLRHALWPEGPEDEHRQEAAAFFAGAGSPAAVLLAESDAGIVGFAEVSVRPYAEGCRTDRVGYLEGWFVIPEARGLGIGKQLVAGAEEWARAQACVEFASDAEADNEVSAVAHRALGFTEVGMLRCFRKDL